MYKISIDRLMHASWAAACGDDIDLSAFDDIRSGGTMSPDMQAQIAIAIGWIGHAYREALVADGECTVGTFRALGIGSQ